MLASTVAPVAPSPAKPGHNPAPAASPPAGFGAELAAALSASQHSGPAAWGGTQQYNGVQQYSGGADRRGSGGGGGYGSTSIQQPSSLQV